MKRLESCYPREHSAIRERTLRAAAAVLSGSWTMLGHAFDLSGETDWHKDPRTDYRWPRGFYADLPLYDLPGETDVKYVWELGRQQYVVELARAWLLSANLGADSASRTLPASGSLPAAKCGAGRMREIILGWIEQNPLYEGIHWTSALEVAMRAISWLWAAAALAEWSGWEDGEPLQIAQSLAEHAHYLEHHLEYYSSPYNHLIGEATALYLIGLVLRQLPEADRWRRRGREVLTEHGPKQFYEDGFCVEQATGYHFYTLGFLTMAIAAGRTTGEPLSGLEPVVHKAYRAGMAFRQPDGRWPAIGDVDSARSIPVHHNDFWQFDSLCAVAAVLFDDPELKVAGSGAGEELYWLLGCRGVEMWNRLAASASPATRVVLPESGYAITSDGRDWLLFDAGPIAAGLYADGTPSAAHGHADTLQVLYVADGRSVLHDCGMPFYGGDPDWVRYFRSPAAHNTIDVGGVEFARPAGGLLDWSHVVSPPRLDARITDEVWLARGRAEWKRHVVIERHLLCLPGEGLWIADWVESDRPRRVRWFWQMSGEMAQNAVREPENSRHQHSSEIHCWSDSAVIDSRLEFASQESPVAHYATGYGDWTDTVRLSQITTVEDRLLCVHYFGAEPPSVIVETRGRRVFCGKAGELRTQWPDIRTITSVGEADSSMQLVWRFSASNESDSECEHEEMTEREDAVHVKAARTLVGMASSR